MIPGLDDRPGAWQSRWQEIIQALVRVQTTEGEEQLLETLTWPTEPRVVAFVNAHAMNAAVGSPGFSRAILGADIVLRDGLGMAILLGMLNQPPGLNLNGTDLIPKILARYAGRPIALYGTQEPFLGAARDAVVSAIAPGSACTTAHGFDDATHYLGLAARQRPSLIVLGMGMPRQEEVAMMLRSALAYPCLIVCGGAIIDFLGRRMSRAPAWMRRAGMEWVYRLALEPRRLFTRYVIGNPLFLARAVAMVATSSRQDRGPAT